MGRAIRIHRQSTRRGERIPCHARLRVHTAQGEPLAPLARCLDIGLGGLRAIAAQGVSPGTPVEIEVRLASGRHFRSRGHIAWSKTTLHPELLGVPRGRDDDATFGIAFDEVSTEDLLPIARLLVARQDQRRRVRRIQRLHGIPIHA